MWLSCKLIARFILWKLLPLPTYGHNYHQLGLSGALDTMLQIVNMYRPEQEFIIEKLEVREDICIALTKPVVARYQYLR